MISEAYREEQRKLHENPNYGVASVSYAPFVSNVINQINAKDVLDYGAGKGRLGENLAINHEYEMHHYDPAREAWSEAPKPHEFVACIDVLEHIEPEYLDSVLDDLKRVTKRMGVFTVHTGKAKKVLSDGRNAHLIQEPMEWWLPKIMERFKLHSLSLTNGGFWVVVFGVENGN
jgi:2-polyprenyl-3-methyl-5-hydroxy-6-metoxy-1,4-benzoquinol methylase